jgi:hypothetical protein
MQDLINSSNYGVLPIYLTGAAECYQVLQRCGARRPLWAWDGYLRRLESDDTLDYALRIMLEEILMVLIKKRPQR